MNIAIASDHAGYRLKLEVVDYLEGNKHDVIDYGCFSDKKCNSIDFAPKVCKAVQNKSVNYGILICGTGIGMSIIANKFNGIRAALCGDPFSAKATRQHNNANIITIGSRVIGRGLAIENVRVFLETEFLGDGYQERINRITELEGSDAITY